MIPAMTENSVPGSSMDILIQAPNWLGDVVMTTPLLTWLDDRRDLPDGFRLRLHLGIRRAWAPLFASDPRLDSLVVHERRGLHAGLGGIPKHARAVRNGKFDAVLLGPPSLRAALVASLARVPRRIGYRGEGRGIFLTDSLPLGRRGSRHYSEDMIELGRRLLPETNDSGSIPAPELQGCRAMDPVETGTGPAVLAVALGTTYGEAKTWPVARVAEFMNLAIREFGLRIVLLGDSQAGAFAVDLCKLVPGVWSNTFDDRTTIVDLTGRTDLPEVARVLKACGGFVGNDSGLMHLAGALGVPTVGIFGSSNPDWTAPRGTQTAAVVAEGYACRPCYRRTCNQTRFCLLDVTAPAVMDALQDLMAGRPGTEEDF